MMRVLVLLVVVLLGGGAAQMFQYYAWTLSRMLNALTENNCEGTNVTRENSTVAYDESVKRMDRLASQIDKSVCYIIINNLEYIYGPQLKLLDVCRKSRQLSPIFEPIAFGTKSMVKFICRNDAEHLIEIVNPCTTMILENKKVTEPFMKFFRTLDAKYEDPADSGKEFGIIRGIRSVSKSILRNCSQIYRETIFGAVDAFLSTCPE